MARFPALFLGHGNPMNAIQPSEYTEAWERIASEIPRPKAILCISAHWYVSGSRVSAEERPRTIHDFGGFPRALYQVQYPAPGSPRLAARVRDLLAPTPIELDTRWGLDHGTWSLLVHLYPEAAETHAGTVLAAAPTATTPGTVSPALGTAGTETLAQWRAATIDAIGEIYTTTSGRAQSNTLYLSADQFFALAALGSDQVLQMSAVGNLDVGAMTGTFSGLRVVGSYGLPARTRIVGDSSAFIVGENPGAPVELRAVEPSIGGLEVGLIGAFQAKNFDYTRFMNLNAHA
jgi:hypothetical protein